MGNSLKDSYWQGVAPALEKMRGLAPLMTSAGNHNVGKRRNYTGYLRWRFDTVTAPMQLFEGGRGRYALVDTAPPSWMIITTTNPGRRRRASSLRMRSSPARKRLGAALRKGRALRAAWGSLFGGLRRIA